MTSFDKIDDPAFSSRPAIPARSRHLAEEFAETLKLAVPIALTQLGQIAMMTTDLALIGRLGDQAVAAAALASTVFFVTFTVGTDGRVVSAYASGPCPFSLLNNAAVAGIRQWRFPPGCVMTHTQPITYTLK